MAVSEMWARADRAFLRECNAGQFEELQLASCVSEEAHFNYWEMAKLFILQRLLSGHKSLT